VRRTGRRPPRPAGEIPIDVYSNHVYVKVCAGERPLDFILDTGAGATFSTFTPPSASASSWATASRAVGAEQGTIAGAQLNGVQRSTRRLVARPDGSIGLDISRLPPREGPSHGRNPRLRFHQAVRRRDRLCEAGAETLRRAHVPYDGPGTSIPVTFSGNHPHVDAEVRLADGSTIKGRMVVDVGSSSSLALTKPFVEQNQLRERIGPTIHRRSAAAWVVR
jgi:hypothetical protein